MVAPPVQTLWVGDSLSELENLCITSYIKQGYDFHLYAYGDIKNVPEDCIVLDANSILDESEIISSLSLSHWTRAPATKTLPSRAYVIFPFILHPIVLSILFFDLTTLSPVFIIQKHPVP